MATGRILKKQISLSEAVNDVSLKAALLFTWGIAHADDFGRMPGSSRRIKAAVVPMRDDFTLDDVTACLEELNEAGLVYWYEVDGEQYVAFPTWEEHQSGLHKRTKSRLPPPPGSSGVPPGPRTEVPGGSGKVPPNGTEQNGTEPNGTEPEEPHESILLKNAREAWQSAVAMASFIAKPAAKRALANCRISAVNGNEVMVTLPADAEEQEAVRKCESGLAESLKKARGGPYILCFARGDPGQGGDSGGAADGHDP